jgi:hypothetical protein
VGMLSQPPVGTAGPPVAAVRFDLWDRATN